MSSSQLAGHLIVECLVAQGVTHAFGVPGESYLAVLDGFHAYRDQIRFIINRQEGGAAFMAEAHGKLTGRPGICFVTRGPGRHQCVDRRAHRVPGFDADGAVRRRRRPATSATARPSRRSTTRSFFGPSTKGMAKRVERIDDADRIPEYVARAFATAMNGRPGPVVLVLPEDMLRATTDGAAAAARRGGRRPGATRARCARCARCCWRRSGRS